MKVTFDVYDSRDLESDLANYYGSSTAGGDGALRFLVARNDKIYAVTTDDIFRLAQLQRSADPALRQVLEAVVKVQAVVYDLFNLLIDGSPELTQKAQDILRSIDSAQRLGAR